MITLQHVTSKTCFTMLVASRLRLTKKLDIVESGLNERTNSTQKEVLTPHTKKV